MRRLLPLFAIALLAGCTAPGTQAEPSLAPRAAEAIDPRVPITGDIAASQADPALAARLQELIGQVRAAVPQFDAREAEAARRAAQAGPEASESWVAAEQALSLLVEQFGVTTQAAANIDQLASTRLESQSWIRPADQQAIAAAAAEVAAISARQAEAIDRLRAQLAR